MSRIVVVSNRLPVTVRLEESSIELRASTGGLATALRSVHGHGDNLWIGWPGELPRLSAQQQRELHDLLAAMRTMPIYLNRRETRAFYEQISNGVLWPLLHFLADPLPLIIDGWETYRSVNEKFARQVADLVRPTDLVWVHDFHLALVPAMLRRMIPDARIGFFLHVPFPSADVFSILPQRREFLEGVLGADLVGFHTSSHVRGFVGALRHTLGLDARYDTVRLDGRAVSLEALPIGIPVEQWLTLAADESVLRRAEEMREGADYVLVGIDRLDYTKGILRRMLAFERLLATQEELRGRVRFIQVTVPSREGVEAYGALRRRIDEAIGRINSRFSTPTTVPIHRIHQSLTQNEVAALYRAGDVMVVTSLRDGMNLVAKEFVACRTDDDGVLILSEFAGAAAELGEALHVNPFDVDGLAHAMHRALTLPAAERRERMRGLRARVCKNDVRAWSDRFLTALNHASERRRHAQPGSGEQLERVVPGARAKRVLLILDYDGTLVPFSPTPNDAEPDAELIELLKSLTSRLHIRVHIVSGRSRESMDRWFGRLNVGLQAEHGVWSRPRGSPEWHVIREYPTVWKRRVRRVLDDFVEATHGSFVEEKRYSLAWHYRNASGDDTEGRPFGDYQARELELVLSELLRGESLEVLRGSKVVEVRPVGLNKSLGVPGMLATSPDHEFVLAIGDDDTDEDLFASLPDGSLTVRVGAGSTRALYRLNSHEDVRRVLAALLT